MTYFKILRILKLKCQGFIHSFVILPLFSRFSTLSSSTKCVLLKDLISFFLEANVGNIRFLHSPRNLTDTIVNDSLGFVANVLLNVTVEIVTKAY